MLVSRSVVFSFRVKVSDHSRSISSSYYAAHGLYPVVLGYLPYKRPHFYEEEFSAFRVRHPNKIINPKP